MKDATLHALVQLNNTFYRENCESFSASRSRGWNGWKRVIACLGSQLKRGRVLDVACGNLRFERFARELAPGYATEFTCIDSCAKLAEEPFDGVAFQRVDVIERLLAKTPLSHGGYDVAVCFGFMHHVPTFRLRAALLEALVGQVCHNGLVALSFWKFAEDAKLAERAVAVTDSCCRMLGIELEDHDFILGWDNQPGAYRYCHSFTDIEISRLLETAEGRITIVDRYDADGRNGALNGYAVIRRC